MSGSSARETCFGSRAMSVGRTASCASWAFFAFTVYLRGL